LSGIPVSKVHVDPLKTTHRAVTSNEFLAKHNILWLPHPPYSPDLALCNFYLFLQLKKTMKNSRFDYVEEIKANVLRRLRAITKK
jgi:hypothetical protein